MIRLFGKLIVQKLARSCFYRACLRSCARKFLGNFYVFTPMLAVITAVITAVLFKSLFRIVEQSRIIACDSSFAQS